MNASVIISIRPEWVQKIFDGEKTLELRKTLPKVKPPFRCYIYCTKARYPHEDFLVAIDQPTAERPFTSSHGYYGGGMVVAEFVCSEISRLDVPFPAYWEEVDQDALKAACLTYGQAHDYLGHRSGYAWHISELKIYEKPKSVWNFLKLPCLRDSVCSLCHYWAFSRQICTRNPMIQRAPQDWCYTAGVYEGD